MKNSCFLDFSDESFVPRSSRYTLFISDLHLSESTSELNSRFFYFLEHIARDAEALYILGDFFDMWLGDDDCSDFIASIKSALKKLSEQGTVIYFMVGNRDFLVGPTFLRSSGCQGLADPTVIHLYGTPVLLTHGDQLCTRDLSHQKFRALVQSGRLQSIWFMLPLSLRRRLAYILRRRSQKRQGKIVDEEVFEVVLDTVCSTMRQQGVQHLIHGHTHRQAVHNFDLGLEKAVRIVLGSWEFGANAWIAYDH